MGNKTLIREPVYDTNRTNSSAVLLSSATHSSLNILNSVYPPILITVGLLCNLIIIFVMRTRYFRDQSISLLITVSSVNDALSLLISMMSHWIYVSFAFSYDRNVMAGLCKFLNFYGWGNCDFGILLITAMTIDRALAAKYPLKRFAKNCKRKSRNIVLILLSIVVLKEFHLLIWSDMDTHPHRERLCDVVIHNKVYHKFWTLYWPWIHLSFLFICFSLVISSNVILVYYVYHVLNHGAVRHTFAKYSRTRRFSHPPYNRHCETNGAPPAPVTKGDKQWQTMTPMLLGESAVLIILTFPFSIQLAVSGYYPDFYSHEQNALLFSCTLYMLYTNKCVTFFVFLATGSRFRRELKILFLTCIRGRAAMRRQKFKKTLQWINAFSQNMATNSSIRRVSMSPKFRPRLLSSSV